MEKDGLGASLRILIVSNINDRSEIALLAGLAERGHSLTLVCNPKSRDLTKLRQLGVEVLFKKITHRLELSSIFFLRKLLKRGGFDLVYASMNRGLSAINLAGIGLPRIPCIGYRGTMGNLSRWNPTLYLTYFFPYLSGIICNCQAVKGDLIRFGIKPSLLEVIYKGHDSVWYHSDAPAVTREELNIPKEAYVLACIANVRKLKGVDLAIKALASAEMGDVYLLVIGEIRDKSLVGFAEELGVSDRVRFLGYQNMPSRFYSIINISLLLSKRREGVARSIVECMLFKVPVIVSDVGGLPEIVKDEERGLVVGTDGLETLTAAVIRMRHDPKFASMMASNAKEYAEREFDVSIYVDNIERYFSALASNG